MGNLNINASQNSPFEVADTFVLNQQIDKNGFKSHGDISSKSFNTSQFDSRASDYFLLLNQKNKTIVKKRKNIKMNYTDDVLEYDLIFAELEKQRLDKETELMKAIQEEQLKQQKIVLESLQTKRENETKIKEQ